MKLTPVQFEKIMKRLDKDPTVTPKERTLILQNMRKAKDIKAFEQFLESIAISEEEYKKSLIKNNI